MVVMGIRAGDDDDVVNEWPAKELCHPLTYFEEDILQELGPKRRAQGRL